MREWLLRGMWPYGLIWILLWVVGILGMGGWLFAHATLALLAGMIGFDEFWRLPFGAAVVGLTVAALYTFRDPSPWRALAIAAFLGSAVALLLPLEVPSSYDFQVVWLALLFLALVGVAITVVSYTNHDGADRADSPDR